MIPTEDISNALKELSTTILSICDRDEFLDMPLDDEDIMNSLLIFMNICNRRHYQRVYVAQDPNNPVSIALINQTADILKLFVKHTTGIDTTTYYDKEVKK